MKYNVPFRGLGLGNRTRLYFRLIRRRDKNAKEMKMRTHDRRGQGIYMMSFRISRMVMK